MGCSREAGLLTDGSLEGSRLDSSESSVGSVLELGSRDCLTLGSDGVPTWLSMTLPDLSTVIELT